MSINNIYCNPKVYSELYGKGRSEAVHNNPDNLAFYLFENKISGLDFEIIKLKKLQTVFGAVELAIIGSSHYFKLENIFTEILTCSEKQPQLQQLIYSEKKDKDFQFSTRFVDVNYSVSVRSIEYQDKKEFIRFEKELLSKQDIFAHAFEKQSAITALHYKNTENMFLLQTWHTYPDYKKIVFSTSKINIGD